ncbi:MarR family winged helix-turn-helix transcriptional regulator [Streptomyces cyaneofuscatus]|uniref:MarR family winged helix-turn-helix transcriptional regulator n=1 Tax=Streptomyces TaxID=1883 RepID=UPI0038637E26|nr:MarR family winged helix-turn-helix transcriptional regulator [Streptomyces cyaneofuscatus]
MERTPDAGGCGPGERRQASGEVAAALAAVGNWMFSTAAWRRIMAASGLGLSLGDYTLLAQVSQHAPVRLSVLAELMGVDKSTLTPPAQRLEARGLIVRAPDPADARAQLVRVSPAGRRAVRTLGKARADAVAELMAGWETDEVERLAERLTAFASAIEEKG